MEPTAPVPTDTPAPSSNPLTSMTSAERQSWKADDSTFDYGGESKTPADALTPEAASSPAPVPEQTEEPASTEVIVEPASEPGKPKQTALTRKAELEREIQELLAKRNALRAPEAPAKPASPPASSDFPEFDVWQAQHPTETWDHYNRAAARHEATQVFQQQQDTQQKQQAAQQAENSRIERLSGWTERLNEAKKDPAFIPALSPEIANLRPVDVLEPSEPVTAENIIAQEVVFLRNPSLMVYLSAHPDEFARIRQLPTSAQIIREMGRLDERVTTGTRATPVAPKLITSASPPPRLVNQRPAEGADPSMAAVNSGDFKAFKAAEDAADRLKYR